MLNTDGASNLTRCCLPSYVSTRQHSKNYLSIDTSVTYIYNYMRVDGVLRFLLVYKVGSWGYIN